MARATIGGTSSRCQPRPSRPPRRGPITHPRSWPKAWSRSTSRARARSARSTASTSTVDRRHRPGSAWPQRRRQDHHGAHPGHAAQAGRGPRHRSPASTCVRQAGRAPLGHRPVRPIRGRGREPDRTREPVDVRPAVPAVVAPRREARRTSCSRSSTSPMPRDRVVKTYSGGMRRRLDLGERAHRPAAPAVPRRADDRA